MRRPPGWETALYLMHDPVYFATAKLGLDPDPKQEELLGTGSKRVIVNCTRQWGKSTITAVKAVHRAVFEPGSLVVAIAPSERQSGDFVRKVREFCGAAGRRTKGDGQNRASVVLENGSRVVGLPAVERTTRGFSKASLLIVDEAARVPDSFYYACLPMLAASDGDLWLMSTPNGQEGFFWDTWNGGDDDWFRMEATAEECPRIGRRFLEEQEKMLRPEFFRQEYMCDFVGHDDALINMKRLEGQFLDDVMEFRY